MIRHDNVVTSKAGCEVILKCLVGRQDEIDMDTLPWGDDERVPAGIETIVEAVPIPSAYGNIVREVQVLRENGRKEVIIKEEPVE